MGKGTAVTLALAGGIVLGFAAAKIIPPACSNDHLIVVTKAGASSNPTLPKSCLGATARQELVWRATDTNSIEVTIPPLTNGTPSPYPNLTCDRYTCSSGAPAATLKAGDEFPDTLTFKEGGPTMNGRIIIKP
jgi:hypothetical protein